MRTDRLLAIITILLNKGSVTAAELAERFEVTTRTIYRDVETLSMAGVPVFTLKGAGGGIRLMEGYTLERGMLSDSESQDIMVALDAMRITGQPGFGNVLEKLGALLKTTPRVDWLRVDISPWGTSNDEEGKFHTLRQAILKRECVAFDYVNAAAQRSYREVEPMQLWFKGVSWYLHAWCKGKKSYRIFRLSRMRGVQSTGEQYDPAPHAAGHTDTQQGMPLVRYMLRFSPEVEHRLLDEYPDEMLNVEPDGSFTVTVSYPEDGWVVSHLLSFGDAVEVLEPPHMREVIKKTAQAIAKKYR